MSVCVCVCVCVCVVLLQAFTFVSFVCLDMCHAFLTVCVVAVCTIIDCLHTCLLVVTPQLVSAALHCVPCPQIVLYFSTGKMSLTYERVVDSKTTVKEVC